MVNLTKMSQAALKSLPAQNIPMGEETGTSNKSLALISQQDDMEVDPDDDMGSITTGSHEMACPSTEGDWHTMVLLWSPLLHSSRSGPQSESTQAVHAMAVGVLARSGADQPSGSNMMTTSGQGDCPGDFISAGTS